VPIVFTASESLNTERLTLDIALMNREEHRGVMIEASTRRRDDGPDERYWGVMTNERPAEAAERGHRQGYHERAHRGMWIAALVAAERRGPRRRARRRPNRPAGITARIAARIPAVEAASAGIGVGPADVAQAAHHGRQDYEYESYQENYEEHHRCVYHLFSLP